MCCSVSKQARWHSGLPRLSAQRMNLLKFAFTSVANLKESKFYLECSVGTLEAKLPLSALRRRVKWQRSEVHLPHREKRWGSRPGWEAHDTMIKPHPHHPKTHCLERKSVVTPGWWWWRWWWCTGTRTATIVFICPCESFMVPMHRAGKKQVTQLHRVDAKAKAIPTLHGFQ